MIKVCPEINQNISLINNTHQEQNESNFLDPSEQQSSFYKQQYLEQKIVAIVNFKEAQIKKIDGKECFSINPFIEVRHKKKINQVFSSTVSHVGGLYPQWNHKAQMLLEKLDDTQELEISLKRKYSCNSTSNQLLGQIYVKIFDLIYNENLNKIGLYKIEILFTDQWVDIQQNEKNLKNQIGKLFNPFKNVQNILKESQKEQVQIIGRIRIQIMMIPYNDFNQQCNIINDWDSQFKFEQIQIQQNWLIFQKQIEIQNQINQVDINKQEIIEDIKDNPYILHTTDKLRIIWDIIIGLFILVSSILTPLNLAFPQYRLQNEGYSSFMYVVDAVFIMDIFLNFISAYEDQFKVQHTDFYAIALNYFQSWMLVDVFSILPFDLIFIYAIPFINYSDSYNRILKSLKFIKLFNMFDTVQDIIQKCLRKSKSKSTNAFKKLYFLMTFMIVFLLICHQIACIWIFIGRESLFEIIQISNSSTNLNWLIGSGLDQATDYQQYTAAFYFTVTTMATVGYGDISGRNTLERIICVMIMIIGVVTFSIVSGQILSIIQSQDQDEANIQKQIDLIDRFQQKLNFSQSLYIELIKQSDDEIDFDFQEEINSYILSLPKNLQVKIFDEYYNNIYYKIYFLQNKPNQFIHWIQPLLQQEIIEQDEYFFVQNDEIEYISFLFDGCASFTIPLSENKYYIELKIGDDFGQLDILFQCIKQKNSILENVEKKENFKRFFTLQAQSDCQVYHLNVDALKLMAQKFPEAYDSLFYDSDVRLQQLLNFQLKSLQILEQDQEIEIKSLKEIFSEEEIREQNLSPRISDALRISTQQNALRKSTQQSLRQSLTAQNQIQEEYVTFDQKKLRFQNLVKQITKNYFVEHLKLKEIDDQINEQQKLISYKQSDGSNMQKEQQKSNMKKIDKLLIKKYIYQAQHMMSDVQNYQSKFENSQKRNAALLAKNFDHESQNNQQQLQELKNQMDSYNQKIDKIDQQLQFIAKKLQ